MEMADHRELGRSLNGLVWDLLGRADRTEDREIFTGDLATGPWFGLRGG